MLSAGRVARNPRACRDIYNRGRASAVALRWLNGLWSRGGGWRGSVPHQMPAGANQSEQLVGGSQRPRGPTWGQYLSLLCADAEWESERASDDEALFGSTHSWACDDVDWSFRVHIGLLRAPVAHLKIRWFNLIYLYLFIGEHFLLNTRLHIGRSQN